MKAETFWGQVLHASFVFTSNFFYFFFFNSRKFIQPFFEFEVKYNEIFSGLFGFYFFASLFFSRPEAKIVEV